VAYEANEPFIGSLVMHLDTLLAEFKPRLTQANYDSLVCILALEVTSHLERVIVKCEFNRVRQQIIYFLEKLSYDNVRCTYLEIF
jgi:hypothetical protein